MKITRFGFFGGLLASIAAYAQTKIEACAPVYYKMPKPCEGQCPACGLAHGKVSAELLMQPTDWERFGADSIIFGCTHCRNMFVRPVDPLMWEEVAKNMFAACEQISTTAYSCKEVK